MCTGTGPHCFVALGCVTNYTKTQSIKKKKRRKETLSFLVSVNQELEWFKGGDSGLGSFPRSELKYGQGLQSLDNRRTQFQEGAKLILVVGCRPHFLLTEMSPWGCLSLNTNVAVDLSQGE